MIPNQEIQAALITFFKSKPTLTSLLINSKNGSIEIREREWQGTSFTYPNIRIEIVRNDADKANYCEKSDVDVYIYVCSELPSSEECDRIAGIVSNLIDKLQFSSGSIRFVRNKITGITTADRREGTWQTRVKLNSIVSR
jgi:hypothetical protein